MDIYRLNYLITIAEEGSVTKAAEKLFVTTSALSQYVTKEERRIGLALFTRMRERWVPTLAGEEYIWACRKVLATYEELERRFRDIKDNLTGKLSIGFPPGRAHIFAGIYPKAEHLHLNTEITLKEMFWRELKKQLEDGRLDLAFTMFADPETEIPDTLEYEVIGKERFVLFVPRTHALNNDQRQNLVGRTGRPCIELKRLAGERFISSDRKSQIAGITEKLFQEAGVKPRFEFECATLGAVAELAQKGVGFAIVPEYFASGPTEQAVVYDTLPSYEWQIVAVTRKSGKRTEAMETIIRFVEEYFLVHSA